MCLLFLSGCNATYNLNISDNKFSESLDVSGYNVTSSNDLVVPVKFDVDEYDPSKIKPGDNGFYEADVDSDGFGLNYVFDYNAFKNSTLLNRCYDRVDVGKDNNVVYISTAGKFRCFEYYDDLDSVNVNVNFKYKLISSNADKVSGNNYSWVIDKNSVDKGIYIEFDTNSFKKSFFDRFSLDRGFMFLFYVIFILLMLILFFFIRKVVISDDKM